ncbi:MAG: threonine ammonia-lyase [Rhodobacterales bacterium TMED271]|nr:MAG: threonine ammonia-lyase [Rhodobacterales bacterium TMED271]RCL75845.1 MAG: threonine ammonia-lyase [Alphaproteobacteria bacterium]|tara:strand:- start:104 stop:1318 length:1215 start_codon:yes stop_codon:yes gene_type:complete
MQINIDLIRDASKELFGNIIRTPTIRSQYLSGAINADVFLKLENLQYTSSFKVRGAYVSIKRLQEKQKRMGVIAMSAGNHAQAVAWWAQKERVKATIVMPEQAPLSKVMKTKSLGAEVILKGRTLNESQTFVSELVHNKKLTLIHPYDDPNVVIGQGTLGLEIMDDIKNLELLVIPIGGGGLISGISIIAKSLNPNIKIFGVQTEKFPSMYNVIHKKDLEILGDTLADGIAVKRPGKITSEIIKDHVDEILLINEFELEKAISSLFENERVVAEGAGAAGVAAIMKNKDIFSGKKVGTVICGGNIDARLFASILNRKLLMDGRMTKVRIDIIDEPGMLARISNLIAKFGGNIIEIYHQRMFNDVPVKNAKIDAIIEALSVEHIASIIKALREDGFKVSEIMERS